MLVLLLVVTFSIYISGIFIKAFQACQMGKINLYPCTLLEPETCFDYGCIWYRAFISNEEERVKDRQKMVISRYSQQGGLRPPCSSPLRGSRVLAPDCRGPLAPSSQSLRNSYKVGHYCVYPLTMCESSVVLSIQIRISKNTSD